MTALLTTKSVPFFFASTSGEHTASGLPYWNCKWCRFSVEQMFPTDNEVKKRYSEHTALAAASASK